MENDMSVKGYEVCSGCGCCLLTCPVWKRIGNVSLTAHGRTKAMQWGATVEEIAQGIDECLLCGACEPVCPEGNKIVAMTLEQRSSLNVVREKQPSWHPVSSPIVPNESSGAMNEPVILLPGLHLAREGRVCKEIIRLLGGKDIASFALYDGREISDAVEAGLPVSSKKVEKFILPLRSAKKIVVADGGFIRHLRGWLPGKEIIGLGEALLKVPDVRKKLTPDDLYVIESRGYHLDYNRLVGFYDQLRIDTGVHSNLDLHRVAIPTGASSLQGKSNLNSTGAAEQVRWIMKGKEVKRIVVEDMADAEVFRQLAGLPVIHVGQLAMEGRLQ